MPARKPSIFLLLRLPALLALLVSSLFSSAQENPSERLLSHLSHLRSASCQIVINGSDVCTGVLMNSTNESKVNYILSAAHCLPDTSLINSISITFGGHPPLASEDFDGSIWSTSFGINILAIDYQQDYVLYELLELIPVEVSAYYLGWDLDASNPAFGVTNHYSSIYTQMSALKRTSIEPSSFSFPSDYKPEIETVPNGFWKVPNWTSGTTSVGASGAGLIDQNENYIGGLTGSTTTTGGTMSDYFFRFDLAYAPSEKETALKNFLDPSNTRAVHGSYFFDLFKTSTFNSFDELLVSENISSTNTVEISYQLAEPMSIRGVYVVLGEVNVGLGSNLTIEVIKDQVSLFAKTISWTSLNENAENYIDFDSNISLDGQFQFHFSSNTDTQFELAELPLIRKENSSISLRTFDDASNKTLKAGIPMISFLANKGITVENSTHDLMFFPNPSNDFIFISPSNDLIEVEVFDLKGNQVYPTIQNRYEEFILNISTLSKGIYTIRVTTNAGQSIIRRLIKY